jgi:integrase
VRGTVVKRGAGYSVVVDLGPDPATGKRRQKWISGFRTKRDAERHVADAVKGVNEGTYTEPSKQTVGAYVEEWLKAIEPTVRPSTLHSYRRNLTLHVVPRIGALRLPQVDAGTLNTLYAELLSEGRADGAGGLAPRSVRYVHTIVHRAFKDAVRWRRLVVNPADAADPPKQSASAAPDMQTWPAETLSDFLERSKGYGDRYYAAWHLLATTGMRRGEVLGLRWSDLDLAGARLSIVQTVIAVKHEVALSTPKTPKGRRSVALDAGTVTALSLDPPGVIGWG